MANRSSLKQINKRYHAHMKAVTQGAHEKEILESLSNGKNTYMRMDRTESSSFDKTWIEVIEGVIFDLGEIIQNPRMFTKTEGSIVPVELARKTNAESVQHLASHTQFVKEIDEYGNVIPSKILTIIADDDIKTYENRFIATLIRRLVLFVEKRYELVAKMAQLQDQETLMIKNSSIVDGSEIEIETKIKISHKKEDAQSLQSNAYIERIQLMRNYILYFYNSDFMKKLKTEKDVHNPILQTNIIRKNPKYHHCYEVYKFIEGYDRLGVNYKIDENFSVFDDDEMKELNRTLFANYITLKGKDRSKASKGSTKIYKPRIITSIDDEEFIYGKHLAGPFEFVRTDALYREYLASKLRNDLPLHPTKEEKAYYADEYAQRSEFRQDEKQLNDLINRINKDAAKFQKEIEKIEVEREQARLELERRQKETIRTEEDQMLEEAREDIINAARIEEEARLAKEAEEYRKFLASIKPAKQPVEMSHPYTRPVTFKEACIDIWPFLSNPQERHVYREEETVILPAPAPVPASINESNHAYQEALTYDEAVRQIWPQINPSVAHDFNKSEEIEYLPDPSQQVAAPEEIPPVAPVVVPAKKPQHKKIPGSFVVRTDKGFYKGEGAYTNSYQNAKVFDEYYAAQAVKNRENGQVIKLSPVSVNKNVAPKKEEPKPEIKQPAPKAKIPGRFIVITSEGYYVSKNKRVKSIKEARVFDEFHMANAIAQMKGGKVVKL